MGSDLDVVVLVHVAPERAEERGLDLPAPHLPVPTDVLVFTEAEWAEGLEHPGIIGTAARDVVRIDTG